MKEFVTNPEVAYIITILGFVFGLVGVVSAFFGIKSYFDQKKTNKAYEMLLNNANMEWEGRYTEEEIRKLNNELSILTEQISKEIPSQAKKALLESKIENVECELRKLCREHQYLKKELEKIHPVEELDENLRSYIQEEMNTDKSSKMLILTVSVFILTFVFLSSPVVNAYFRRLLTDAIYVTKAKLYVEHITTYIMAMVAMSGIALIIPIKNLKFIYNKFLSALISIGLFAIWGVLVYLISFDILIVNYVGQLIAGFLSLLIFAFAFKIMVYLIKNRK